MGRKSIRSIKPRKLKALDSGKGLLLFLLVLGISIGFSALATGLTISGNATVKKKQWDATEVSYSTSYNPSVTNSKEAIEDLYDRLK